MPKTFKEQVDDYFSTKYSQLESTTTKIIKKYNRTLEASNVLSHTYLYILEKEPEIIHFSRTFTKSLEHTIYSFTLNHINRELAGSKSVLNQQEHKVSRWFINSDEHTELIDYQKNTTYKTNICNEEFIESFHKTLSKVDAIYFQAYYYDGFDNAKDLAKKFDINNSSAYLRINRLKAQMKLHIQKNQIE